MPVSGLQFPLAVNQPEVSEGLIRALDLKGDQPSFADGYYQVGITALDLCKPPYQYLRRELAFMGGGAPTAAAATFSGMFFGVTPLATGQTDDVIAVIDRIRLFNNNGTAQGFWLFIGPVAALPAAGYTTLGGVNVQDIRIANRPAGGFASRFRPWGGNPAGALGGGGISLALPPNSVIDLGPYVLVNRSGYTNPPGLLIEAQTANVTFGCNVWWRERQVLQSELNP